MPRPASAAPALRVVDLDARRRGPASREGDLARAALDAFPYGVLVLGAGGVAVAANPAALAVLGPVLGDGDAPPTDCCALFGCGRARGALDSACLHELALSAAGRLPELRVDLPGGRAAWVTSARVGEGEEVVLCVRPGDPRDRRRRADPHWVAGPDLRVAVLGRTELRTREGPLAGPWLDQRPGQLLKLLICERHRPVHLEEIAEAFWPEAGPGAANNVRHFVHALRDRLEPDRTRRAPSSFVLSRGSGYGLDLTRVRVDADEFEQAVARGLELLRTGEHAGARERLEAGLALYRGPFMAEEPYAEWALAERDRLHELCVTAGRAVVLVARAAGDIDGAAEHLGRLARLDPYDGELHRELVALCLQRGRRSEAQRRYATFRARLLKDFGQTPEFTLADVGRAVSAEA